MNHLACTIDQALRGSGGADSKTSNAKQKSAEKKSQQEQIDTTLCTSSSGGNKMSFPERLPILDLFAHLLSCEDATTKTDCLLSRGKEPVCGSEHKYVEAVANQCKNMVRTCTDVLGFHERALRTFDWYVAKLPYTRIRRESVCVCMCVYVCVNERQHILCTLW